MRMNRSRTSSGIARIALAPALAPVTVFAQNLAFTVYASGLNGSRGLAFGPKGELYVAEAGTGGANTTVGICPQAAPAVAPYRAGRTARIVKVTWDGTVVPVAQGFPSAQNNFGDVLGVADLAFLRGQMYALVAGGGCSHGDPDIPAGIARVDLGTGTWSMIADLGAFIKQHPVRYINQGTTNRTGRCTA